jgi:tetratricopeptide (TPR) repeat protein
MTPELWQRLKPLFHEALEKGSGDRAAFIDAACGEDQELKMHLGKLIEAEQQGTRTVDAPLANLNGMFGGWSARFQPGELILGRFRILHPIGKGGMGEVYEAEDLQLGIVALKTLRHGIASSPDAFERFRQEVQLARRITSPQVCRIHELYLLPASGKHEATAFLTMEYLDGVTLFRKVQDKGPLPWKEALKIALEICEGLRIIHENGIIHRDLKSGNIMVCEQGGSTRVVLVDFGLARDFQSEARASGVQGQREARNTLPHAIVGTPEYMAPEQFEGDAVTPATDIYALGIILYELVTGLHPYAADTPVAAAIRRARQPRPPSFLQPKIPKQCDRVVKQCLEYDPQNRFQSAKEVAKALRAGPSSFDSLKKDRPWVLWLASAVVAGMIAVGVFYMWRAGHYYQPKPEALRWYDPGVAAIREGNYVKATRSLQEATAQDSNFAMAHARLAEAWANLDFDGNAQRELLLATPEDGQLRPLDRMYLDAIRATVTKDHSAEIATYRQILDRLPQDQKPSGYVDLGMAYQRAGDPNHALENYAKAASLDSNSPAPFMRTAILQSRQHVPEADKAFQRAQTLLSAELNQEGLAELDYERGYAANLNGDTAGAERYLKKALEEAKAIPSVQLQIRTLNQLSVEEIVSDHVERAVDDAEEAIHLAQSNQLDLWAADGYVRLANAELRQRHLQKAEDAAQEALQLSRQSQQHRTEAGANLALASIMDQRHRPDEVIAPAQAALDYYKQNGFFRDGASASLLLLRTRRNKGEYSQALESGRAFQELATKSGNRQLMALSDEVVGSVHLEMEQYPAALERFQSARSEADGTSAKAYQALHCANALWKLGRYKESDEMLQSVPSTETFKNLLAEIQVPSLISRGQYKEADTLSRNTLADNLPMEAETIQEFELWEALGESHIQMKAAASKHLEEVSKGPSKDTADGWRMRGSIAETDLALGSTQQALDGATKAADHFAATKQLDSELRSLCVAASAAKALKDTVAYEQFSKKAVDILSQLQQTWEPQALRTYLSRSDLQTLMRGASISAPFDRR